MSAAYRTKSVLVTSATYSALKAFAEAHGLDCPDAAAELMLNERIATDPRLQWMQRQFLNHMDLLKKELADYDAKQQPDDPLP